MTGTPHRPLGTGRLSRRTLLAATGAAAAVALTSGPARAARAAATVPLYLGTYTSSGGAQGIGIAAFDPATGAITGKGSLAGVSDPSFLASAPGHLYAVNEQQGSVTAIAVRDGELSVLGSSPTGGEGPCHLLVHGEGGHVLSANYTSGSVSVHPLAADGSLREASDLVQHTGSGPDPDRQEGPHAHMVLGTPSGRFVLAVDLGTDSVYTYRLDTGTGKLEAVVQNRVTPGLGPRHAAFHPGGSHLYVANELGDSLSVCSYDDASGEITVLDSLPTVPSGDPAGERNYPAEVLLSPDGAYVYVSNRGHDSIARFAVGGGGGELTLLDTVPAQGSYPRHISLDPTGRWLFAANQKSGSVGVFARDEATGTLKAVGTPFAAPTPVCVLPVAD
ncbi:secreted protein [Streptomyces albus]|uniref:Secreted protein n=1 Tax=Streptomyces albus (strain ATCC 21838 / DSM 41398 / FERM P-419 / JCM 4703 / NBRC 107858) TaxID=1081613 RepID=H6D599_STRA4|nr:putative secreted protein [Streptomyces albus]AJE80623.1 secreted protein [Streptomyces albus]AOU74936.1 secreted protein [Streptomyces albus]AYN30746.1 6-phosphogluconolactonase [Streptomyces albus]